MLKNFNKCLFCDKEFISYSGMLSHILLIHNEEYKKDPFKIHMITAMIYTINKDVKKL